MKIKSIRLFSAFILISSIMAVESEEKVANEKYAFIKEIYEDSWALIIGINKYENVDPLAYAVDDAEAVNDILIEKYGFEEEKILLLGIVYLGFHITFLIVMKFHLIEF